LFRGFFKITGTKDEVGWPFAGSHPDKIRKAKHVESIGAACLDAGSTPASSTEKPANHIFADFFMSKEVNQL